MDLSRSPTLSAFNRPDSPDHSGIPVWPNNGCRTLLCLGDSTTFHHDLPREVQFPALLERRLNEPVSGLTQRWQVANAGKHGDCGTHGLRRFHDIRDENRDNPPDSLLIELGANDFFLGNDLKHLKKALQRIIDEMKSWNERARIVLGGMIFTPEALALGRSEKGQTELREKFGSKAPQFNGDEVPFGNVYREISEKNSDVKLIPYILDGIIGIPGMTRDLIHASPAGHQIICNNVESVFLPIALSMEKMPILALSLNKIPFTPNGNPVPRIHELQR